MKLKLHARIIDAIAVGSIIAAGAFMLSGAVYYIVKLLAECY